MTVDERLRAAWAALQARRPEDALSLLDGVRVPDRPGAEARAAAWRAQALDALGRLPEAERAAAEAVRLARRAGEADGVTAARGLHQRLLASLAASAVADKARLADLPLAETSDDVLLGSHPEGPAVLVRKANVLCDLGRPQEAVASAARALDVLRATGGHERRDEVLALLTLARALPEDAAARIHEAHAIADASDDMNLLTAVAKAASAAGVRLHAPSF